MRQVVPLLCFAAACGGSSTSTSLQGPGSFNPNATLAIQALRADGGIENELVFVAITSSTPVAACAVLDAGFPDGGLVNGEVDVLVSRAGGIKPGTFSVTDVDTFFNAPTTAGEAFVSLSGPSSPPSNSGEGISASISGTVTLTKAGSEWAGSFTATMVSGADGGQSTLSGSFDTSTTCYAPPPG